MHHSNTLALPSSTASCVRAAILSLPDGLLKEGYLVRGAGKSAGFWKAELGTDIALQRAMVSVFGAVASATATSSANAALAAAVLPEPAATEPAATVLKPAAAIDPDEATRREIAKLQAQIEALPTIQFGAPAPTSTGVVSSERRNPLTGELLAPEHNPNMLGFGTNDATEAFARSRGEMVARLMAKGTADNPASEYDPESIDLLSELCDRYFKFTDGDQLRAVRLSDLKEYSKPVFKDHIQAVFSQHRGANEHGTFVVKHTCDGQGIAETKTPAGEFWLDLYQFGSQRDSVTGAKRSDLVVASTMVMVPTTDPTELDDNHAVFNRQCDQFNLWHIYKQDMVNPNPSADASALTPLINHLLYLANDDEAAVMHFVYWLAFIYQNPGKKACTATVFHSNYTGLGKSMIARLLKILFGERLVVQTTGAKIQSQFTTLLKHKRIVWVDEMDMRKKPEFYEEFKAMISEDVLSMEDKYDHAHTVANHVHFVLTTNHVDCLPLEDRERRINAISCGDALPRSTAYYEEFGRWMEEKAADVAQALKTLKIPDSWNAKAPAPQTEAAKMMQQARAGELRPLIEELIEARKSPFDRDFGQPLAVSMSLDGAYPMLKVNPAKLAKALRSLGYDAPSQSRTKQGRMWLCYWRNVEHWTKWARTPEERSAHIESGLRPFTEGEDHE